MRRTGNSRWRRLTEERAGGAKWVFHFDVQGQLVKSTHAGIVRYLVAADIEMVVAKGRLGLRSVTG